MANNPISLSNQIEFNDSVLTTKAWNSSRYDGRQLSASQINRYTEGDSTFGKTPVIQNYTRNIYIGSNIVSIDSETKEDPNLLPIDDFSYLQTNRFITVNEDDTITDTRLEQIGDDINPKIGFYQSFFDDFPEQSGCRVVLFDNVAKNNLKPNYIIYFNGGQLNQILKYSHRNDAQTDYHVDYSVANNNIRLEGFLQSGNPNNVNSGIRAKSEVLNSDLIREFYPLLLENLEQSSDSGTIKPSAHHLGFFNSIDAFKTGSSYRNNRRYFITLTNSASNSPIRTIATGSIPAETTTAVRTNNLAELSTIEYTSASIDDGGLSLRLHGSNRTKLNFDYDIGPQTLNRGSVILSKVSDSVPSLLVNLNKSNELVGDSNNVYAIIPENLHPYIKDNILFFLTQAGIDVGGNTSTVIKINPSNRLLK